jgi:hypothetical protein
MAFKYNVFTNDFDIVEETRDSFPKYLIEVGVSITVGSYGQYVIHDIGYLEVAGYIELEEGAMIIIEQGA